MGDSLTFLLWPFTPVKIPLQAADAGTTVWKAAPVVLLEENPFERLWLAFQEHPSHISAG